MKEIETQKAKKINFLLQMECCISLNDVYVTKRIKLCREVNQHLKKHSEKQHCFGPFTKRLVDVPLP